MKERYLLLLGCLLFGGCGARTSLIEKLNGSSDGGASASTVNSSGGNSGGNSNCGDAVLAHSGDGASLLEIDGDVVFFATQDNTVWKVENGQSVQLAIAAGIVEAIAIDSTHIYYTDGANVSRVPREGIVSETISTPPIDAAALKADEEALYILDRGLGTSSAALWRVPTNGTPEQILSNMNGVYPALALDDERAYVMTSSAEVAGQQLKDVILSVSKNGGEPTVVAHDLGSLWAIDVFDDQAYFLTGDSIQGGILSRVPKAGGAVQTLWTMPDTPQRLAVDQSGVYITHFLSGTSGDDIVGSLDRVGLDGSNPKTLASTKGVYYTDVRTDSSAVYWAIGWFVHPTDDTTIRKRCK